MKKNRIRKIAVTLLIAMLLSLAFGTTTCTAATKTTKATVTATANTEKNKTINKIYKKLIAYKSKKGYTEGTPWGSSKKYISTGTRIIGYGCAAFVLKLSDKVYGSKPIKCIRSSFTYQSGDIVHFGKHGQSHFVIILKADDKTLTVAEGNYNSSVHWNRKISVKDANKYVDYIWRRN